MREANTLILRTAALLLVPMQLLFSVFLLLRGHDEPGGGFIAGLVASGAVVLFLFSYGVSATRELLRVDPRDFLGVGLLIGLASILPSLILGQPAMTAQWWQIPLPGGDYYKFSTPLIFDVGVYLTVIGSILTMVVGLSESEESDA
ncbi:MULTISPECIES: Na+/H+ antiporter subunit B [Gammaproteobacteria]|jgi:multicomponent Na+:H+ antiporter subunit B|uniref:Na+/H+ antiporter subunit B n=1 Tax=Vreelandella halophila TaxID=86177 RepID=A0A9X5B469_9GAMM|nr:MULTISPECIES: Na+/H+ antiporter subunit B [Gammaproteobacteria]KAA8980308.1 Na+/H+ antiporter subunit B [Halospina sp. K52047b]MYL25349.1 Na+/H+ antiporter subunit B [Halomonas utahensis]MYL75178.1 Na+/H+ antiporter subunit B [Halomonas sp. 22501_18_FS]